MAHPTNGQVQEREALRAQGLKVCVRCKRTLPLADFGPINIKESADGLRPSCRACDRDYQRDWYRRRMTAGQRRRKQLAHWYGLTPEQWLALYRKQKKKCAICGRPMADHGKSESHVDHDHKTGRVRGLLCHTCNNGLGCFKDDPALLRAAIAYLKKHT